ncbi:MAG: NfeD family protein [Ruthenibacterium sp.]
MVIYLDSIVWTLLLIGFIVLEVATVALVSIWFVVGSAAALIATVFTDSIGIQIGVFVLVSALSLLLTRPLLKKKLNVKATPTNAERNLGRTATVILAVSPEQPGRVKLDGVDWPATSTTLLAADSLCVVDAMHGNSLCVSPLHVSERV